MIYHVYVSSTNDIALRCVYDVQQCEANELYDLSTDTTFLIPLNAKYKFTNADRDSYGFLLTILLHHR